MPHTTVQGIQVERHRTAMKRVGVSRPVRLALEGGLIIPATTVFDYGCGHGSDMCHLQSLAIRCEGWDPALRPHTERSPAEVVNLGYVVNVIEDPKERVETLRLAWGLATRALVISARLKNDVGSGYSGPAGSGNYGTRDGDASGFVFSFF
jgi:DNA phosphorothioation-associated putative methyltransferase